VTFPGGLTTIEVTGLNILAMDGTPLNGAVIFTPSGVVADSALSLVLEGSAVGEVSGGVMTPLTIPTTDSISPSFAYTVAFRLQAPDGVPGTPAPLLNVSVPHTLGASVDLSALVPLGTPPPAVAFGTANTWTATQTFDGSPAIVIPTGAVAGDVLTSDADGNATWQSALTNPMTTAGDIIAGGSGGAVTRVPGNSSGTREFLTSVSDETPAWTVLQVADVPALPYDAAGAAAAAQAASLQKSANLSDLSSAGAARTSLGLGSAATASATAFDAAGAASAAQAAAEAYALPKAGGTMTGPLVPAVVALSQSGGAVAVNAALGNVFTLTLTASGWTVGTPTGGADGQVIRIRLAQDSTGGRTVTWGAGYDWGAGNSAPTLTVTASRTDVLAFEYNAALSEWMYLGAPVPQGF
jgi:hypothetical protein